MVGNHTADSHRPCEGVDSQGTAGILDTEDILPYAGASHRALPRNHGAEVDIPEAELRRLLGEIHHDTHEAVEEDNHTEAAVLPACREAFVHPDGHLRVVVADDAAEAACGAVVDREVLDGLPPFRILRQVALILPFSVFPRVVLHLPWLLSVSLLRWAVPLLPSILLVRSL